MKTNNNYCKERERERERAFGKAKDSNLKREWRHQMNSLLVPAGVEGLEGEKLEFDG